MPVDLSELSKDALRDLASVRKIPGHTDMTKADLIDAMDDPAEDDLTPWLGMTRKDIYEAATEAGIDGAKDEDKRSLILQLAGRA